WQKEVLESCLHYVKIGIPSLSWDQYWTEPNMNIIRIMSKVRAEAKRLDPESTLSGEEMVNLEVDADYLDFTWNWGGFRNCQAFTNVFPSPRISCIVTEAPYVVKAAFLDNLYLNVMPRKTESVNGSDWIYKYQAMSEALKECAALRSQFLEYFTEGRLIGSCLLSEPCPNTHIASYIMPDRALLLVMNQGGAGPVHFKCDLAPWLDSDKGDYTIRQYDSTGKLTDTLHLKNGNWNGKTPSVETFEITLFEITGGEH
ncbi:MAG TPA: hypothetical protein PKH07_10110, partial [bacterium]|nr:hypothetical protein [bacterium]